MIGLTGVLPSNRSLTNYDIFLSFRGLGIKYFATKDHCCLINCFKVSVLPTVRVLVLAEPEGLDIMLSLSKDHPGGIAHY